MNDHEKPKFKKELESGIDWRRALISFAGGFVGWIVWGCVIVLPLLILVQPSTHHIAIQFLIFMAALFPLFLFAGIGKYLALKWFGSRDE